MIAKRKFVGITYHHTFDQIACKILQIILLRSSKSDPKKVQRWPTYENLAD